jgi:hypothetical protein
MCPTRIDGHTVLFAHKVTQGNVRPAARPVPQVLDLRSQRARGKNGHAVLKLALAPPIVPPLRAKRPSTKSGWADRVPPGMRPWLGVRAWNDLPGLDN